MVDNIPYKFELATMFEWRTERVQKRSPTSVPTKSQRCAVGLAGDEESKINHVEILPLGPSSGSQI